MERYIEVFGGGGWVLFHKEPSPFEVFNDFNADLVNLYRCIRDKPEKLIQRLEYTLNAREDFEHIRKLLKSKAELTDIQRAAGYYQLIRQSYASTLDSFGGQPTGMWATFPVIRQAAERLQRVVIDNRDFEKVIGQYRFRLPKAGALFDYLKSPAGYFVLLFLPFFLLMLSQGIRFFRLFKQYKERQGPRPQGEETPPASIE